MPSPAPGAALLQQLTDQRRQQSDAAPLLNERGQVWEQPIARRVRPWRSPVRLQRRGAVRLLAGLVANDGVVEGLV